MRFEGVSGSRQLQILFLGESGHVFCVFLSPQYFETDDPEFYKSKVCFILNNDMSEMELVFAEEKYNKSGQLDKVRQRTEACGSHFSASSVSGLSSRAFAMMEVFSVCTFEHPKCVWYDQIPEFLN